MFGRLDPMDPSSGKTSSNAPRVENDWIRAISKEFHALQTDSAMKKSSVFDLIDICTGLYEDSLKEAEEDDILQGPNPLHDLRRLPDSALRAYIKGYLVLTYFISNFVMMHFKGFDVFIESSERDFYLYLRLFLSYNENSLSRDSDSNTLLSIRDAAISFLIERGLLNYDVSELHEWLIEWVQWARSTGNGMIEPQKRLALRPHLDDATYHSTSEDPDQLTVDDAIRRFPPICGMNSPKKSHQEIKTHQSELTSADFMSLNTTHDSNMLRIDSPRYSSNATDAYPEDGTDYGSGDRRAAIATQSRGSHPMHEIRMPPPVPLASAMEVQNHFKQSVAPYDSAIQNDHNENSTTQEEWEYQRATVSISDRRQHQDSMGRPALQHVPSSSRLPVPSMTYYPQNIQPQSASESALSRIDPAYRAPSQEAFRSHQQSQTLYAHPHQNASQYMSSSFETIPARSKPLHTYNQQSSQSHSQIQDTRLIASNGLMQPVCGLHNFGATCYINLTMQILFAIPDFTRLFGGVNSGVIPHQGLSDAIKSLLRTFQHNSGASVTPSKFIRTTSYLKPDFHIPSQQQDAQEFLLFMLQRLHEELCTKPLASENSSSQILSQHRWILNIPPKDEDEYFKWYRSLEEAEGVSPINDMFQGHLQNKLTCNRCGCESISYSPFTILSLPIPRHRNRHNAVDLRACLDYYTEDEVLKGSNSWNCPKCHKQPHTNALDTHPVFVTKKSGIFRLGRKQKLPTVEKHKPKDTNDVSTKSLRFIKLPSTLFIHLARFSASLTNKLDVLIEYPTELQMAGSTNARYVLTGVINHYGNLKGGHYTAVANKATGSSHWFQFDDEVCRANAVPGSVTSSGTLLSRDAYVLCYERV